MTDIDRTVARDLLVVVGKDLDGSLGLLVAYLDALEARIATLERRLAAVPLMTAADAARYARVNVETILRAVRAGELAVAGYIARSPRISRGGMGSAGLNVARQLDHRARRHSRVMTGAPTHRRPPWVHATLRAQRPASGASGFDRIVGVMSASRSYEASP